MQCGAQVLTQLRIMQMERQVLRRLVEVIRLVEPYTKSLMELDYQSLDITSLVGTHWPMAQVLRMRLQRITQPLQHWRSMQSGLQSLRVLRTYQTAEVPRFQLKLHSSLVRPLPLHLDQLLRKLVTHLVVGLMEQIFINQVPLTQSVQLP